MSSFASEFYGLPEYVITHIRTENLEHNRRIYHWVMRGGMLVPQFTAFVAAKDLIIMSDMVQETLTDFQPLRRSSH